MYVRMHVRMYVWLGFMGNLGVVVVVVAAATPKIKLQSTSNTTAVWASTFVKIGFDGSANKDPTRSERNMGVIIIK